MRTLLDESLPPQCAGEKNLPPRIFSQNAVLAYQDDLTEVGLGETVSATPGAGAEKAIPALERGAAILETSDSPGKSAEQFQTSTPAV
jgi:hypothetical protein